MSTDAGPRCGGCRLGLGTHNPADPLCVDHPECTCDGAEDRPYRCPEHQDLMTEMHDFLNGKNPA